jgi:proteic killer suppression protein
MDVLFADDNLKRLESDRGYTAGPPTEIVRAFRKAVWFIRNATDERDLRNIKSRHFEKLKGKRRHQHSMRLNDQYRLIVEMGRGGSGKQVTIISIEDYH